MADIIITGKDYNNFNSTYSDLNIIRSVNGTESLIKGFEEKTFNVKSGNIDLKDANFVSLLNNGEIELSFGHKKIKDTFWETFLRTENAYKSGTCIANFDGVIDFNSISIVPKIIYKRYDKKEHKELNQSFNPILNNTSYLSSNLVYNEIFNENNYVETKEIDNSIPFGQSSKQTHIIVSLSPDMLIHPIYQNIGKPYIIDENDGKSTIGFDYNMLVWSGFVHSHYTPLNPFNLFENFMTLYVVESVSFEIQAVTIEESENSFKYNATNQLNWSDESYELESNELMQYTSAQLEDERISKIVAMKIFNKTKINRQIVSFDLLNVQKYDFDNGDGTFTRRYLTSRDKIKIKDENGNWVGEYNDENGNSIVPYFEIVQIENIWDGKFYKRITAKQLLN